MSSSLTKPGTALEQIEERKIEVLGKLRREQAKMKYCIDELGGDLRQAGTGTLWSWRSLRRAGTLLGGVVYGVRIVNALLRLRRKLH